MVRDDKLGGKLCELNLHQCELALGYGLKDTATSSRATACMDANCIIGLMRCASD